MIISPVRRPLFAAEAGFAGQPVQGSYQGQQADAVAWLGAYRHRVCAFHQVPRSIAELDTTPAGVNETHQVIWTAGPVVSHYVVRFAYQATDRAQSASERAGLNGGITVVATLRKHADAAIVDGVPAVEWAAAAGTLVPRVNSEIGVFGIEHFPGLDSYPISWASSSARIDLVPAVFPARPRVLNAFGMAGTELRLELTTANVRLVTVRVFEFAGA